MEPLLSAEHITICYNGIPAVQDVSFQVEPGEILGIVGESGSGKSTLIRGVMGLLGEGGMITGGDIWYKGENLKDMPEKKFRKYQGPEIGMVFQDCKAAFCPSAQWERRFMKPCPPMRKSQKKKPKAVPGRLWKRSGLPITKES